jgi:hypothetical protein
MFCSSVLRLEDASLILTVDVFFFGGRRTLQANRMSQTCSGVTKRESILLGFLFSEAVVEGLLASLYPVGYTVERFCVWKNGSIKWPVITTDPVGAFDEICSEKL